jgi:AraC-like DNA-binding protein
VVYGAMGKPYTVSSVVPFIVAEAARREGIAPERVLGARAGQAPPRADEQLDVAEYFDFWRRVMTLIRDPAFPVRAASVFQLEDHEVFGFLAMSCKTLGQAYEKTASYRALYCVGARWELGVEADASRLVWHPWPGDINDAGYRAAMDFAVADMANAIRRLGRSGPQPLAVLLVHAAPAEPSGFQRHYGVQPTFATPLYELVYPPDLSDLPVTTFNSRLRDYFDQECHRLVSQLAPGTSMVELVRRELIRTMDGGDTSIEATAKRLGLSPRSLQRRLAEEGARYNDLLTAIRAEFAKSYLARGTVSASEVAYLVGFTEPPAFFKAFKRWTGLTPGEFQQAALS